MFMPPQDYSPLLDELLVSLPDFSLTGVPGHSEHAVRIELGSRRVSQNEQEYSQTDQTAQEGLGERTHLLRLRQAAYRQRAKKKN